MHDQRQEERAGLEPSQEQLLAALRAQGIEGRRVLEIGCGVGHLHHRLLDEGAASVVGVEFSAAHSSHSAYCYGCHPYFTTLQIVLQKATPSSLTQR